MDRSTWPKTGATGVYGLVLVDADRWYIGSAVDLRQRWHSHLSGLRHRCHPNPKLQAAWNKHGEEAFEFRVLEYVTDVHDLLATEQRYLDLFLPHYNICPTAGNKLGVPLPADAVEKMRRSLTGQKRSPKTKERLRQAMLGRTFTPESIERMRQGHRHISHESRAKMAAAKRGIHPVIASEASRLACTGKPRSAEVRAKISATKRAQGIKRPDLAERNRQRHS